MCKLWPWHWRPSGENPYARFGHGQQSCEVPTKSELPVKIYSPFMKFGYVCTMTLTFEAWPLVKVITYLWIKFKVCLWNTMPPAATKSKKLFLASSQNQGHKVIDLGVIWKGVISGVCMPNIKSLSLTVQMLEPRLKLTTDRQTNRQTRQKQYEYSPDHSIWGHNKKQ